MSIRFPLLSKLTSHARRWASLLLVFLGIVPWALADSSMPATEVMVPSIVSTTSPSHFAWISCYVRVPDEWAAEEGLLANSVTLTLEGVTDAAEVYVNSQKIGECGSLPPLYRAARDEVHRIKIPPGTLKQGELNRISLHLYGHDGRLGFAGPAPTIAGYHTECRLTGKWELWPTTSQSDPLPMPTAAPSVGIFSEFRVASSPLARPTQFTPGRHLEPQVSLQRMRTDPDLAVDLVLSEPTIAQPISMDFDAHGRLWLVEYRQYPYPAGINMVSRDKFYRAVYDRQPDPPPHHTPGADRISIHADLDGDGQFDDHKVFLDGLNIVSAIELAHDGVWVLNPPYLLFYPDRDHNDVPDGDPDVVLRGFGLEDTHSIANSLTYGPDGWLYGIQGSTTSSRIEVMGRDQPAVYCEGAMVWRFDPITRRYEIFGEGGGNAFGLDLDAVGNLFTGHNGDHTRGFHYLQGAYMQKGVGGNKYGPLSNPYAFGFLGFMSHAPTPRFSHDLVRYEETSLPSRCHNKFFSIDPLHQNVVLVDVIPDGSTFRTEDKGIPLQTEDFAFRPVDITVGPDGAVYVADFCEEFIAHGQHFQGQIDPSTGRVYRLRSRTAQPLPAQSLPAQSLPAQSRWSSRAASVNDLIRQLSEPNRWWRRQAAQQLVAKRDLTCVPTLATLVEDNRPFAALESLWILAQLGQLTAPRAKAWLNHPNPDIRRWVVRLTGDQPDPDPEVTQAILHHCDDEPEIGVRAQLACTARRLPAMVALPMFARLCAYDGDLQDRFQPLLLWWALEQHKANTSQVMDLFRQPSFWHLPIVRDAILPRLMRAYGSGGRMELEYCALLLNLAPDADCQKQLLLGFEEAFQGRTLDSLPETMVQALSRAGGGSLALRVRQGNAEAIQSAIQALADASTDPQARLELVRLVGEARVVAAVPTLLTLLSQTPDPGLSAAILSQLQGFDHPSIAEQILHQWSKWPAEIQADAALLLSSRVTTGRALIEAIHAGKVVASLVPPDAILRLSLLPDETVRAAIATIWPQWKAMSPTAEVQTYQRAVSACTSELGSPYAGSQLFQQHCAKCHTLFRQGGNIGPNLTSYERSDAARLLLHITQPSLEIREGYEQWTAVTDDGRVVNGFLYDQDKHVVILRGIDGQNVTLLRDKLESLVKTPQSLMPSGLLDTWSDGDIRNLIAYLRVSQPLDE